MLRPAKNLWIVISRAMTFSVSRGFRRYLLPMSRMASIVPVCMGSPVNLRGVSNLLDDICGYFPSPDSGRSCNGIAQKTNEIFEANYDFAKAKSAYVWKSIADPFLGKYSLIKVCSGVLKADDTLLNVEKGAEERVNKLYVPGGLQADRGSVSFMQGISAPLPSLAAYRPATALLPRRIRSFIQRLYFPFHIPIRDLRQ